MFNYNNLNENESALIKNYLQENIEHAKLDENDTTKSENYDIGDFLENIFDVTNELLRKSSKESMAIIHEILEVYLKNQDIDAFDIFNTIILQLISSGYKDATGQEDTYTFLLFPIISMEVNKNIDEIHSIIKKSCVKTGLTDSENNVIPIEQILPHDFQNQKDILDCYNYTEQFFKDEKPVFQNIQPVDDVDSLLYYIPVFVKGEFQDVLEFIREHSHLLSDNINTITNETISHKHTEIFTPVLWNEATADLLEDILNKGTSYAQISKFCEQFEQADEKQEVSIVRIKNDDSSALLLLLDQREYSVLSAKLILGIDDFIENAVLPIMQQAILNKLPMSIPKNRLPMEAAIDLFQNKMIEPETNQALMHVFSENEPEHDLNGLYKIYSGSTMIIQ